MKTLREILAEAIETQTTVLIEYKDELRHIEPHHIGVLGGTTQVHAYQVDGREGWRNFKLDCVTRYRLINKEFEMRPDYNSDGGNYTSVEEQLS